MNYNKNLRLLKKEIEEFIEDGYSIDLRSKNDFLETILTVLDDNSFENKELQKMVKETQEGLVNLIERKDDELIQVLTKAYNKYYLPDEKMRNLWLKTLFVLEDEIDNSERLDQIMLNELKLTKVEISSYKDYSFFEKVRRRNKKLKLIED